MTASRKDVREALAVYLSEKLVSAEAIYSYQVADFGGRSPIVYLTSSSSNRERMTGRGLVSTFVINAHLFVLYPSETTGAGYSEQDAENILDALEYQIAQAVNDIHSHSLIKAIAYAGNTNADTTAEIGGETYLHEIVPLQINCF